MTNAACERAIKPVALLRRNSLFFNTKRGAEAGMVVHSLVETARRNGANPELYLQYVLEEALAYKNVTGSAKLDELMPWSEKYKAWEREKFADNKAFSLKSNTKPYYKPDNHIYQIQPPCGGLLKWKIQLIFQLIILKLHTLPQEVSLTLQPL